ncbi:MAG: hypothetical protein KC656_01230 [Myxococcales bacterium]|nr:hypothetical protein [Myxococcales bacterium]MCB9693931.1 hypothetical protein [Alphaproteobacteria bacterium]
MATTPKSWTSSAPLLLLGILIGLTGPADARRPKKDRDPQPEPAPVAPAPKPVTPPIALFDAPLPMTVGPMVPGLANTTAQACGACHFGTHGTWATSDHALGWRDTRFTEAVRLASTPACTQCHLPFLEQSPELVTYDADDVDKPLAGANPAFDASLRLEGVTCAACHVRDGKIVGPRPPELVGTSPHPLAWSEELTKSEGCATCHQLTWEGAKTPFYDTYGEWERSPYAKAGITCQDCHGGGGAGSTAPFDHGMPRETGRAVSVLLDLPSLTIVRGDETPVALGITLQNTGAGHAFPTGSPFTGIRVRARIVGPPDRKGVPYEAVVLEHDLGRTLTDGPPWDVTADTRIPAGGQIELTADLSVPYGAPEGDWALQVDLLQTAAGVPVDAPPSLSRELPLSVE